MHKAIVTTTTDSWLHSEPEPRGAGPQVLERDGRHMLWCLRPNIVTSMTSS